jgi:hypothetical protein
MIIQVKREIDIACCQRVQCLGISEVRIIDHRYVKRLEGAIIDIALRGAQKKEEKREGRSTSPG